jgi:tripartite-type tricarboxylate transporter receptor subunit TctC
MISSDLLASSQVQKLRLRCALRAGLLPRECAERHRCQRRVALLNPCRASRGTRRAWRLDVASVGPASSFQIAFEKLKRAANVEMTFVLYPGDAPAIGALSGEHVTSVLAASSAVAGQLSSAKLRALAVATKTRSLCQTACYRGVRLQRLSASFWRGVVAPAKTPKERTSQQFGSLRQ